MAFSEFFIDLGQFSCLFTTRKTFQFLTPKTALKSSRFGKKESSLNSRILGFENMMNDARGQQGLKMHNGLHHLVISYSQCQAEATIWESRLLGSYFD